MIQEIDFPLLTIGVILNSSQFLSVAIIVAGIVAYHQLRDKKNILLGVQIVLTTLDIVMTIL